MGVTDEVGWRERMAEPQGAVLGTGSTHRHQAEGEFSSFFILHKTSCRLLLAR